MNRCPYVLLSLAAVLAAQAPPAPIVVTPVTAAGAAAPAQKPIDLAICLDISGSMDGLINAARQNLWAVVNDLATLQPTPTLRVALLSYGCDAHDKEKGWVAVETDFTTDLDLVSQKLFALTTNGGSEYVARAVRTALDQLHWSPEAGGLKLLFVAGNEAANQDPTLPPNEAAKAAITRGIVVNTIYCGNPADELAPAWREVAQFADGKFAAIEKDDAVVIATPFDEQLAALSASLNATYVPYGTRREAWVENQRAQDSNAAGLNTAAAAARCQTKAGLLYMNSQWDLVDACDDPKFDLAAVKKEELPEELRALTIEALRAHVAGQKKTRGEIRAKVAELGSKRDAFVLAERKKLGSAAEKMFETAVLESVRAQAAARGFHRATPPAPTPEPAKDVVSPFTQRIKDAARDYRTFVRVTGDPHVAPELCRIPPPPARLSAAEKEHGQKLYLLYARQANGVEYVEAGKPATVGQTLVKESWQAIEGESTAVTEASRRYMGPLRVEAGGKVLHAGAAAGLFVMHKLAADTPDTDQGWVYGTVDRNGVVTAAGRVASCMRCHESATEDRRFGLR